MLRRMRTYSEHGILAEFQRLRLSIAKQVERAASFVDLYHLEVHGLPITVNTRGLQTCVAELLGHVGGCFFETAAAGGAAFEAVVGKKLDVGPPQLAQRVPVRVRGEPGTPNKSSANKQPARSFHLGTLKIELQRI